MFEHVQPLVGPYAAYPLACRKHDPRAAEVARLVAGTIASHLSQARAEHVGSTSVPGCAGKGVVDLMIPMSAGDLETVKELLCRLGFQGQIGREPFPETRPMLAGCYEFEGESFPIHLHLIPAESEEVADLRFFRACLRGDTDLVKAYVACKRKIIAGGVTDSLEYCKLKGDFIKQVLG